MVDAREEKPIDAIVIDPKPVAPVSTLEAYAGVIEDGIPKASTENRGFVGVLGDQSGSMGGNKAVAVRDAINNMVRDFIQSNTKGPKVNSRFDVSLIGYGLNDAVNTLLKGVAASKPYASLEELNKSATIITETVKGEQTRKRVWVDAVADGNTPMNAAFGKLRADFEAWVSSPDRKKTGEKFIALGINVTDGVTTDGFPSAHVEDFSREVKTAGGELLMTNIHITEEGASNGLVFPTEAEILALKDTYATALFEISSPVPAELMEKIPGIKPGARMMAYNASFEQFAKVFRAGSTVAAAVAQ